MPDTPTDDTETGDGGAIVWTINMHGGGSGVIRQVPFGLGDGPTRILLEVDRAGDDVSIRVTVGDGPDLEHGVEQAIRDVVDMLGGLAEGLAEAAPSIAAKAEADQAGTE